MKNFRIHILSGMALLCILFALAVAAQSGAPKFEDYPARSIYKGQSHAVLITTANRMYRTRLREAAREKPNFAGHYILATWGCGAACQQGAVIDAQTGIVVDIPFTVCCWTDTGDDFDPVQSRLDSNLLIVHGTRDEKENDDGTHYYKFENGKFVFIKSVKSGK